MREEAAQRRVADGVARLQPIYAALLGQERAAMQPRGQGILMVSLCGPHGCGVSFTSPTSQKVEEPDGLPECVTAARQLRRALDGGHAPEALPMTLAADNSTIAVLRTRPQWFGLWNSYMPLDTAKALRAFNAAGLLRQREQLHLHFLWKLMAQAVTPYEETFYLDNDVLVLQPTLARHLLSNTLRLSDLVMPLDPARPPAKTSVSELRKQRQSRKSGDVATTPPMYDKGIPPLCTCVMAYRRTPSVQRLLEGAAVRLALSLNPVDPTVRTGSPVVIRQSDQEMLWLELTQAPPDPRLRLFVLPEEYFCPAYWPQVDVATSVGISFYDYVSAWSTHGKPHQVAPRWTTGYSTAGYECKATHFHHSHAHLLEARPRLKRGAIAAFEEAIGRPRTQSQQTPNGGEGGSTSSRPDSEASAPDESSCASPLFEYDADKDGCATESITAGAWRKFTSRKPLDPSSAPIGSTARGPSAWAGQTWRCSHDALNKPGWIGRWHGGQGASQGGGMDLTFHARLTLAGSVTVVFARSAQMGRASLLLNGDESTAVTLNGLSPSSDAQQQLHTVTIPVKRLVGPGGIRNGRCNCTTVKHPAKVTLSLRVQPPGQTAQATDRTRFRVKALAAC